SRRAKSANPLGPDCAPIGSVIGQVEALYREQQMPPICRVPSFLAGGIEEALAARGYAGEGDTRVLYGPMGGLAARADPAVTLSPHAGSDWLAAMGTLQGSSPKTCWPYIVPTASQLRLTWRATALASRQARCTGLSRCRPKPPVEALSASTACTASLVT